MPWWEERVLLPVMGRPSLKTYLPPGRWSAARPPQFEPSDAVCHEWSHPACALATDAAMTNNDKIKVFIGFYSIKVKWRPLPLIAGELEKPS